MNGVAVDDAVVMQNKKYQINSIWSQNVLLVLTKKQVPTLYVSYRSRACR